MKENQWKILAINSLLFEECACYKMILFLFQVSYQQIIHVPKEVILELTNVHLNRKLFVCIFVCVYARKRLCVFVTLTVL